MCSRLKNVFPKTKISFRGGLALVNYYQWHPPNVTLRTISSWFRRHFVGSMFWYRETGGTRLASGIEKLNGNALGSSTVNQNVTGYIICGKFQWGKIYKAIVVGFYTLDHWSCQGVILTKDLDEKDKLNCSFHFQPINLSVTKAKCYQNAQFWKFGTLYIWNRGFNISSLATP